MRCLGCQYDLANLSEHRCPECGRAFDPNDPSTFDWQYTEYILSPEFPERPLSPFQRFVSWILLLAFLALVVYILWPARAS